MISNIIRKFVLFVSFNNISCRVLLVSFNNISCHVYFRSVDLYIIRTSTCMPKLKYTNCTHDRIIMCVCVCVRASARVCGVRVCMCVCVYVLCVFFFK